MALDSFSSDADSDLSFSRLPTSAPSSPPPAEPPSAKMAPEPMEEQRLLQEEANARSANDKEEARRVAARNRRKKKADTRAQRDEKAKELDALLSQTATFSDILTKKTHVLGRVGSGFDGKALGEHDLQMANQPKSVVGGTMRDYQLEGLTWMVEICSQGMSGILADEMGLGKTVQTISLIALLREQEGYLGPHLIVAPLSTLSNWINEFRMWTPSIPVVMYHGTPKERKELFDTRIRKQLVSGRPTKQFPVVCTSYEIILRDRAELSKINWEFIIIDEGHRMKNFESKLFREMHSFKSATRFLITGTPLQNNLKELWSLLNFLMPKIFTDWESFDSWFDFAGLEDEEGAEEFIADRQKQELVKKMHLILQPLLLRRIKADVASYLPKKREYILFAPMTKEQTDLYNVINDKTVDTRAYLENKVVERLTDVTNTPTSSRKASPRTSRSNSAGQKEEPKETREILSVSIRSSPRAKKTVDATSAKPNAFAMMMAKKGGAPASKTAEGAAKSATKGSATKGSAPKVSTTKDAKKTVTPIATPKAPVKTAAKRKISPASEAAQTKSAKTSRESTPGSARGRTRKGRRCYKEAEASDEDLMSDDEFEAKLAEELAEQDVEDIAIAMSAEEFERTMTLELAKREIANKKLGNPLMQLRLVCNSPHNFYDPWSSDANLGVDESIVTASGKMLLLDRLLPALFQRGHKVLIFSQFKTQLDILEDYCRTLRKWRMCRIDGSVAQDDRRAQIEEFNTDKLCNLFLLSTRAGGQGINLAAADTVILFDSDWNPQQDLQAQDRAHRIGQTRPVVVFRLATKGTVEEDLLMSADAKRRLEKLVIKKGAFRSMGQKMDGQQDLDKETLRSLLLKDGQVYKFSGDKEILSDEDINVLCDRSDAAYAQAALGEGDADGYQVIETGVNGITPAARRS